MKASEEAVRQLQEEEERLVQTLDFQARQDEELARKIVSEEIPQVRYCGNRPFSTLLLRSKHKCHQPVEIQNTTES